MPTTKPDIYRWLQSARSQGKSHVVVVVDTFSHEDYPIYTDNPRAEATRVQGTGDRVMEVYSVNQDWHHQLAEVRAFHYD